MADAALVQTRDPDEKTEDQQIVDEAHTRFGRCESWESRFHGLYIADQKFGHADSDNLDQWPDVLLNDRELMQKVTLTINKTRVHCLQIINDAKQNKPGIKVIPTTNEATYEAAEVYEDVVRHIEYRSKATQVYDKAMENTVFGGYAVARVVTQYVHQNVNPKSVPPHELGDQEILIKSVNDPLSVYFDPDAKEADKSDGEFAFVFDDMPKDKFDRLHPKFKNRIGSQYVGAYNSWISKDNIRVAEYWRKEHKRVVIVTAIDPTSGERVSFDKDEVPPSMRRALKMNPDAEYQERDADFITVRCYKLAGNMIIDRYDWLGQYIPLVPMIAEEVVIDGQMDRKGHVRYLKDPQRMYNYMSSRETEVTALQTNIPWTMPAETAEEYEEYYKSSNIQNLAFLPYKAFDDEGRPLPPPQRTDPPRASEAAIKGLQIAENEMAMASGQYQATFGQQGNEISGKAINERQRQGDNATYGFINAQGVMVGMLGRIVVDLIPKVYDTKRILRMRGEDGIMRNILIDPTAQEAVQKKEDMARREASIIFNPNVGMYSVEADTGPNYATKRQEAWNAIVQILSQNKQLIPIIGDLLFTNGDFPGASEIAQRMRRLVPKEALSDEPGQQDMALQAQVKELSGLVDQLNVALKDKTAEINIKAFEALSKRLQVIGNAGPIVSEEQAQPLIAQTEAAMLSGEPSPAEFGAAPAPQQMPPDMGMMPEQPLAPPPGNMLPPPSPLMGA
jgi:hypothetical protein